MTKNVDTASTLRLKGSPTPNPLPVPHLMNFRAHSQFDWPARPAVAMNPIAHVGHDPLLLTRSNGFMRNLVIHSWYQRGAQASQELPSEEALLERLRPAADLTTQALARLALRARARCPISVPLRSDADAAALVAWLAEAGALVSSPPER